MKEEAIIEVTIIGNIAKIIAIDPKTGTEVSVQAPAHTSRADMSRLAMRKLQYVLARNQKSD